MQTKFYPLRLGLFTILLCLFHVLFSASVFAQATRPINTRFNTSLKRANATFVMPEGFKELDSGKDYRCNDNTFISPMVYTIVNSDNSIRIGFAPVFPLGDDWGTAFNIEYSSENQYLLNAESAADENGVTLYEQSYVKQKFNADHGGEFFRDCTGLYEGIYPHNRVVFIQKADRGYFEINYIYTDKTTPEDIKKVITQTAGMIRYLP